MGGDPPFLFLDAGDAWGEGGAATLDEERSGEAIVARVQVLGGDFTSSIKVEKPMDTARSRKSSITRCEALIALARK